MSAAPVLALPVSEYLGAEEIVSELALALRRELEHRRLVLSTGTLVWGVREWQVSLDVRETTSALVRHRHLSLPAFRERFVVSWAIEFGIKLSRPCRIHFVPLWLPDNLAEAAIGTAGPVSVRMISKYDIHSDQLESRFDVGVQWVGQMPWNREEELRNGQD